MKISLISKINTYSPFCIFIPGKLQGKQRPRFARKNKINFITKRRISKSLVYTPKETVDYEKLVASIARLKLKEKKLKRFESEAIGINITAFKLIPDYKKNKLNECDDCIVKPDADNIIKIILDSLNKVVYADDQQISEIKFKKMFTHIASKEGIYVTIYNI